MLRNIVFLLGIIAIGVEFADIGLSENMRLGLISCVSTAILLYFDWRSEKPQLTSIFAYLGFALLALIHLHILGINFLEASDDALTVVSIFIACMALTTSAREAFG